MHPNAAFRATRTEGADRALLARLVDEIGFGMVFAATPDGPRVAHVPLLWNREGRLQFHLARGNALTRHLDGATALAVVNGPEGYVSPRWYEDGAQVPTWNYVALECEGPVRRINEEVLLALLEKLSARHEARIAEGEPWTMAKTPPDILCKLLGAIVGFEIEVKGWRETLKLSQNKPEDERERVIAGLEEAGSGGIAALMRVLGPAE